MKPLFVLLRPHQWPKNLMLYFPPLLAGIAPGTFSPARWLLPFVLFALISSAAYVLNDLIDVEADRLHPRKCRRPLPSGVVAPKQALLLLLVLLLLAFFLCFKGLPALWPYAAGYLLLSLLYSLALKRYPLCDLLGIAALFLVRLQAGGAAFDVRVSPWLFASVLWLALFLSAGKRLSEAHLLGAGAQRHRKVLGVYRPRFLFLMVYASALAALLTYAGYVVVHPAMARWLTLPLCVVGLWRYVSRVRQGGDGDPTAALLRDPILFVIALSWAMLVGLAAYG